MVTVLDQGIGLAASAANALGESDNLGQNTEVGYLIAALSRHKAVSFSRTGNIGLPWVQEILTNLDGFICIRTGNVEISRDMIASPVASRSAKKKAESSFGFIEWVSTSYDEFHVGPRVGTCVVFAVPVDYALELDQ